MNTSYRISAEYIEDRVEISLRFRTHAEESDYGTHTEVHGLAEAVCEASERLRSVEAILDYYHRVFSTARHLERLRTFMAVSRAALSDAATWLDYWDRTIPMMISDPRIARTIERIRGAELIGFTVAAKVQGGNWPSPFPEDLADIQRNLERIMDRHERPVSEVYAY